MKTARKHNITGLPGLSLGTTKNDRGAVLTRYSVNYKKEGKPACKSFYFGAHTAQKEAYQAACEFMKEQQLTQLSAAKLKSLYSEHNHESLI